LRGDENGKNCTCGGKGGTTSGKNRVGKDTIGESREEKRTLKKLSCTRKYGAKNRMTQESQAKNKSLDGMAWGNELL